MNVCCLQCDYQTSRAMKLLRPCSLQADTGDITPTVDDDIYLLDDFCFVCRDGGSLILCDHPSECRKVYHPACVELDAVPKGTFICPYHKCNVCNEELAEANQPFNHCAHCPNSYCCKHIPSPSTITESNIVNEWLCPECTLVERENSVDLLQRNSNRRSFIMRVQSLLQREGRQMIRLPRIQNRILDLAVLYVQVVQRGGFHNVIDSTGWKGIMRALDLKPTDSSALAIKRLYISILLPYEKQFSLCYAPVTNTQVDSNADVLLDLSADTNNRISNAHTDDFEISRRKKSSPPGASLEISANDDRPEDVVSLLHSLPVTLPSVLPAFATKVTPVHHTVGVRKRGRVDTVSQSMTAGSQPARRKKLARGAG